MTPVSSSTNLVARLLKLIGRRENGPSERLKELLKTCDKDHRDKLEARFNEMGKMFLAKYTKPNTDHPGSHESIAKMRLRSGEILAYKILEAILFREKSKNKAWSSLLEQNMFHRVLFACCLEIVIFSYNSPSRTFPWILNTLELKDYDFYKVKLLNLGLFCKI